jgi:hypothetical protein
LILTLREDHKLRLSSEQVCRRIFGAKKDEATGDWRKYLNEDLHNLNSLLNIN